MPGGRCDSRQVFEALPEDLMWAPTTRAQHAASAAILLRRLGRC
jgi:hypothetical protein